MNDNQSMLDTLIRMAHSGIKHADVPYDNKVEHRKDLKEFEGVLQELVSKSTSMEVTNIIKDYPNNFFKKGYQCPSCKKLIMVEYKPNNCERCGQVLYFREEDWIKGTAENE